MQHKCQKCGWDWISRKEKTPARCARCRSWIWSGRKDGRRGARGRIIGTLYDAHLLNIGEGKEIPREFGLDAVRRCRALDTWARRHGRKFKYYSNNYIERVK